MNYRYRFNRIALINNIAGYMWEDVCLSLADDLRIKPEEIDGYGMNGEDLSDDIWNEASYILALTEIHNKKPINKIAEELETYDLGTLGYYIYMQTVGHGVAWSDDHDKELKTVYYETIAAYFEAIDNLPDEAREWYNAKELTNNDAYDYAVKNNRELRLIKGPGPSITITYDDAKYLIDKGDTKRDDMDRSLIMVKDWRN